MWRNYTVSDRNFFNLFSTLYLPPGYVGSVCVCVCVCVLTSVRVLEAGRKRKNSWERDPKTSWSEGKKRGGQTNLNHPPTLLLPRGLKTWQAVGCTWIKYTEQEGNICFLISQSKLYICFLWQTLWPVHSHTYHIFARILKRVQLFSLTWTRHAPLGAKFKVFHSGYTQNSCSVRSSDLNIFPLPRSLPPLSLQPPSLHTGPPPLLQLPLQSYNPTVHQGLQHYHVSAGRWEGGGGKAASVLNAYVRYTIHMCMFLLCMCATDHNAWEYF